MQRARRIFDQLQRARPAPPTGDQAWAQAEPVGVGPPPIDALVAHRPTAPHLGPTPARVPAPGPLPTTDRTLPSALSCPMTGRPFRDPVVLFDDGVTYERSAIADHLGRHPYLPSNGEVARLRRLAPAWAIRQILEGAAAGAPIRVPDCPVTRAPLADPVVLADGHALEAEAHEAWLKQRGPARFTSPLTGAQTPAEAFVADVTLGKLIAELRVAGQPALAAALRGDVAALATAGPQALRGAAETTPLILASRYGHVEAVRWLLAQPGGARDRRDAAGQDALFAATCGGHRAVVLALLDAGAAVDGRASAAHLTPLMEAARRGWHELAQVLLQRGADPSATVAAEDGSLKEALYYAAGHPQLLALLQARLIDRLVPR